MFLRDLLGIHDNVRISDLPNIVPLIKVGHKTYEIESSYLIAEGTMAPKLIFKAKVDEEQEDEYIENFMSDIKETNQYKN